MPTYEIKAGRWTNPYEDYRNHDRCVRCGFKGASCDYDGPDLCCSACAPGLGWPPVPMSKVAEVARTMARVSEIAAGLDTTATEQAWAEESTRSGEAPDIRSTGTPGTCAGCGDPVGEVPAYVVAARDSETTYSLCSPACLEWWTADFGGEAEDWKFAR